MQQLDLLSEQTLDTSEPPPEAATLPALRKVPSLEAAPDTEALLGAAESLGVFSGSLASTIRSVFDCIEYAEEEIDAAKKRFPEKAEEIHASFRMLRPTEPLEGLSEGLYRHHARELIGRVRRGEDLELGTTAEVLGALSKLSQVGPPSREMTLLYGRLFRDVYPEKGEEIFAGITADNYELERTRELESEFRRKLSVDRDPG